MNSQYIHPLRHRPGRILALLTGLLTVAAFLAPPALAGSDQQAFSTAELTAAGRALTAADIIGTAWAVDPQSHRLDVMADETVSDAEISQLKQATEDVSGALRIERTAGQLRTLSQPAGGDELVPDGVSATAGGIENLQQSQWCTLGFSIKIGNVWYLLIPGHCYDLQYIVWKWPPDPGPLAKVVDYSFPGDDFALLQYYATPRDTLGSVDLYNGSFQDITGAANPVVGQAACSSGATSGLRCGQVTGLNWTVNYANGTVSGLTQTNICSAPGDSGGPLFTGGTGLGIASGGTGDCTSGRTTFFQPLVEILNRYGATVY